MTCNTADAEAEAAYLELVQNFLPAAKPWLHRLNEFYVACPWREHLDMARYGAPLTISLALASPWLICRNFGL